MKHNANEDQTDPQDDPTEGEEPQQMDQVDGHSDDMTSTRD